MKIPLNGGAYQARSLIASAQACINLMPEHIPAAEGEPTQTAHYPTPGAALFGSVGSGGYRALYRARNGTVFGVVGSGLYTIASTGVGTLIYTLTTTAGPVGMCDNNTDLLVVDGSTRGVWVDLASNTPTAVVDAAFYGADRVDVLGGYFVLNRPGTNQFYFTRAISRTFDPLYIAAKDGLDKLVTLAVINRNVWLIGETKVDIYSLSGATDFPVQIIGGGIDHGCVGPHAIVRADGLLFWVDQDRDGRGVVLRGGGYQAARVSTHAIETALGSYSRLDDCIGWSYQVRGHTVAVFTFPTANVTWCYDLATEMWHQMQSGGARHLGACHASAFGRNLVGDYANGNLYRLDPTVFADNGVPITRQRAFPHLVNEGKRVVYSQFLADMQCGTTLGAEPIVTLDWSDDRGATYTGTQTQTLGVTGATLTSVQFQRLGMARDRVFRLTWSAPVDTALQGAWIEARTAGS